MRKTLIFSDCHVEPNSNLDRFFMLANYIQAHKPDNIVQMGDFITYDSISSFNTFKPLVLEGMRVRLELSTARRAYYRIQEGIEAAIKKTRVDKKKVYNPRLVWIEGNHEDRAVSFTQKNPQLEGLIDYKTVFNPEDDGWEIVPYREYTEVEGILMTHCPMNGMNKPVGGRHSVKNNIRTHNASLCYGHSHQFAVECDSFLGSNKRGVAVNCGCFIDLEEELPEYARGSALVPSWWSGIVVLHHDDDNLGEFDVEAISLKRLYEECLR